MEKLKNFLLLILAIGLVIFVHEVGHLTAAKMFKVRVPSFSVGFGPKILSAKLGQTEYKISAIPLGGYTSLNNEDLQKLKFWQRFIILISGIVFNLIFAFIIFFIFFIADFHSSIFVALIAAYKLVADLFLDSGMYIYYLLKNKHYIHKHNLQIANQTQLFFVVVATISVEIAFFNLLPIPFLDGGQIAKLGIRRIFGNLFGPFIDLILLILVIIVVMVIKKSKK